MRAGIANADANANAIAPLVSIEIEDGNLENWRMTR